ncbi:rRNA maturation RNase YbeY [Mycoplasmoides alvi]|uniref:rRNA maturation RNase YbeY n=1 Tax=Mycoplasmoides alvi TaxID=78580 RepID=UPI00051CA344|nr:rRNA maturation RNase YbeY [Mycoplasmoides alvi]
MLKRINNLKTKINNINISLLSNIIDKEFSKLFNITLNFFYEIIFLDSKKMLTLNKKTRNKNYIADVITISFLETKKNISNYEANFITPLLGEIYLCPEQIKINAIKYNVTFLSELSRMYIHGVMHLLDFDHEKSNTLEYLTLKIQNKINKNVLNKYKKYEK